MTTRLPIDDYKDVVYQKLQQSYPVSLSMSNLSKETGYSGTIIIMAISGLILDGKVQSADEVEFNEAMRYTINTRTFEKGTN